MKNHNYVDQGWGWAVSSISANPDGCSVSMSGHGSGIRKSDTLTMKMRSGKIGKFEVTKIEYCNNPSDMWSMEAMFVGYVESVD